MKKLNIHFQLYINGEWRSGSDNQIMHSQNPHNNQTWASFDCASKIDIDLVVKSAKDALNDQSWKSMTATDRGKLLNKLADLIEINAMPLPNLLKEIGFVSSTSEARRLIEQNALKINEKTVNLIDTVLKDGTYLLKLGKKKFIKVKIINK